MSLKGAPLYRSLIRLSKSQFGSPWTRSYIQERWRELTKEGNTEKINKNLHLANEFLFLRQKIRTHTDLIVKYKKGPKYRKEDIQKQAHLVGLRLPNEVEEKSEISYEEELERQVMASVNPEEEKAYEASVNEMLKDWDKLSGSLFEDLDADDDVDDKDIDDKSDDKNVDEKNDKRV
eukprot:TRINITY_DN2538_c0_g2_i2.p1 TRINITY_DN2538_c0_g2~~TRINITY_DN2538_c0_g2_i2.p1  ORF type:complete len:177 (-),score=42.98 TRINITY_DN2538_c0_g2_i2:13-543(-)